MSDKQAADAVKSYAMRGRLVLAQTGWLLLEVPNSLLHGAFEAIREPGVELPRNPLNGRVEAHISVMRPEEIAQLGGAGKITERGHEFSYTLGPLRTVSPPTPGVSRVWYIEVKSPELEKLRKSYGLTATPNNGDYQFHITVAQRNTGMLLPNGQSKVPHVRRHATTKLDDTSGSALIKLSEAAYYLYRSRKGTDHDRTGHGHAGTGNGVQVPADAGGGGRGDAAAGGAGKSAAASSRVPSAVRGGVEAAETSATRLSERGDNGIAHGGDMRHPVDANVTPPATIELLQNPPWKGLSREKQGHETPVRRGDRTVPADSTGGNGRGPLSWSWNRQSGGDAPGTGGTSQPARGAARSASGALDSPVKSAAVSVTDDSSSRRPVKGRERPFTVAVDLDGTLAEHYEKYDPETIPDPREGARDAMQQWRDAGYTVIIHTVRGNKQLVQDWLEAHEIPYDYINENPNQPADSSSKLFANAYVDDRGVDATQSWPQIAAVVAEKAEQRAQEKQSQLTLRQTISRAVRKVREPKSEAQAEAGNYRKGHVHMHGLRISIETPAGKSRRPEWPPLKWSYGYIRQTEGKDGDHVDVILGPDPDVELVYVVDQVDPKTGRFDEHKVVMATPSLTAAKQIYRDNYAPGWQGLGDITPLTMQQFKAWLKDGDQTKPIAKQVMTVKTASGQPLSVLLCDTSQDVAVYCGLRQ